MKVCRCYVKNYHIHFADTIIVLLFQCRCVRNSRGNVNVLYRHLLLHMAGGGGLSPNANKFLSHSVKLHRCSGMLI
jgi:hypothetical protein